MNEIDEKKRFSRNFLSLIGCYWWGGSQWRNDGGESDGNNLGK